MLHNFLDRQELCQRIFLKIYISTDLTPLHLAAGNSYAKETLELLLMHHDIKPEIKNNSNETAFEIARRSGRYYNLFELVEPCFQL